LELLGEFFFFLNVFFFSLDLLEEDFLPWFLSDESDEDDELESLSLESDSEVSVSNLAAAADNAETVGGGMTTGGGLG